MNYFTALSYIISHIFLILFIYLFIVHRYSKMITGAMCFALLLFLSILDGLKLACFPDSSLCYVVTTILQILLTQATPFFISGKRRSQTLFIGLSASSYVIAGAISAAILKIWIGSTALALIGSSVIHLAILLLLSMTVRELCLTAQKDDSEKNWWELCLIPVFFYCSFSFTAFFPNTLYDNPDNITGIIFMIVTMFVSYIVVIRYLKSESKRNAVYWKNMIQESYIQGLENRHYLVERAEQNLKILHHDIRHYSQIIDSLLAQKKYGEIKEINEHISRIAEENKVEEYCGNLIVNTIFANMMEKARLLDIKADLDVKIPKDIPVDAYELTLVIANLFENAIHCVKEFVKEKRYIEIKVHCLKDHLFIQTKNEYEGNILLDANTGLPKSRKSGNHGLGMQSILAFSEKNGGTIGCYLEDGIFRIMLFARF